MTHVMEFLFWMSVTWLGYVYIGYPALLRSIGFFRSFHPFLSDGYLPKVSVLLSARNEQEDIGWKIAETLAWNYPKEQLELFVASDASEDGTDEILRNITDPRFRYLRLEPRKGKNEALNRLSELAQGELLFFSDANSHIGPTCLRNMVRHFADSRVGCVTGSERTIGEEENLAVAAGTRAFLGYESLVNTLESSLGSVLVCDGSIFCIRRRLFSTLQPDLANDLELPSRIAAGGHAILFDPLAVSFEKATSAPREEFHRKRRICGQGILGLWRLRHFFGGLRAWQFFSRKLLRWLGAIPLALMFFSTVWLTSNAFYAVMLALQFIFYGLAIVGWWLAVRRRRGSHMTTFPFYFVMVNIAALTGVVDGILGKRFRVWDSPAHSRGCGTEFALSGETRSQSASTSEGQTVPVSRKYCTELRPEKYHP